MMVSFTATFFFEAQEICNTNSAINKKIWMWVFCNGVFALGLAKISNFLSTVFQHVLLLINH